MRRTKRDPVDDQIAAAWHRLASGVAVPVMDIPNIFRDVRTALAAGTDLDAAINAAIRRYEVNA